MFISGKFNHLSYKLKRKREITDVVIKNANFVYQLPHFFKNRLRLIKIYEQRCISFDNSNLKVNISFKIKFCFY